MGEIIEGDYSIPFFDDFVREYHNHSKAELKEMFKYNESLYRRVFSKALSEGYIIPKKNYKLNIYENVFETETTGVYRVYKLDKDKKTVYHRRIKGLDKAVRVGLLLKHHDWNKDDSFVKQRIHEIIRGR